MHEEKYNKKQVDNFLKQLCSDYCEGQYLNSLDSGILLEILALSKKFSNISEHGTHYTFKVENYRIANGRKVKMIWACRGKHCMPIPKSQLLSNIWPPKKKQSKEQIHIAQVKQAARGAIGFQISRFRESIELPITCPLTLKKLTNWSSIHIDHIEPFSKLLEEWLDFHDLNPYDIALEGPKTAKTFKDKSLLKSWSDFHQTHARLQAVHSKANLRKGAKTLT